MPNAFQVTPEDIECVLHENTNCLIRMQGKSIVEMSVDLLDEVDHGRIEKAALNASTDLDEQTNAALNELKANLVELGVITH